MFKRLVKQIILLKTFALRTMQYISLVNTIFIFLTFKKTYNIEVSAISIIILGLVFCLIFGYIDYNYFMPIEFKQLNIKSDIKHDIKRIEEKLDNFIKNKQ